MRPIHRFPLVVVFGMSCGPPTGRGATPAAVAPRAQVTPAKEPEPPPPGGSLPTDDGDADAGEASSKGRHDRSAAYLDGFRRAVQAHWSPGPSPDGAAARSVVVQVSLRADGTLSKVLVLKLSGLSSADRAAIDAVRAVGDFDPPPAGLVDPSTGLVTFRFELAVTPGVDAAAEPR